MVTRLLDLIEGPPTRLWIIGQTPRQVILDTLQLAVRATLLLACSGSF